MDKKISKKQVKTIELLSKLKINKKEEDYLTRQFNETLVVIERLNKLDTKNISTTSQVTGLSDVFREDKIDKNRILSQKEALSNSHAVHKGYFVVDAVLK